MVLALAVLIALSPLFVSYPGTGTGTGESLTSGSSLIGTAEAHKRCRTPLTHNHRYPGATAHWYVYQRQVVGNFNRQYRYKWYHYIVNQVGSGKEGGYNLCPYP